MKKILTTLLVASTGLVFAQPTINSSVFPVPGNTITYQTVDPSTLTPGAAGANQTWDFTGAVANGATETSGFVTPASTPYAASHPGSTVCETFSDGSGGLVYTYYASDPGAYFLNGLSLFSSGNTVNFVFSNPQKMLQYPFNYNNSFTDSFAASFTVVQAGITISNYRSGIETVTYDGYGTLLVPGATYNNVARVKVQQSITDSTVYIGLPAPPIVQYFSGTTHDWMATGLTGKLAQFTLSFDTTTSTGNPPEYNSYARYQTATTGLSENEVELKEVKAYPNPAAEFTQVVINGAENGEAVLKITDMNGRTVKEVVLNFINPDNNLIRVDLTDYAQGIYNLQVTQQTKIWSSKVVRF